MLNKITSKSIDKSEQFSEILNYDFTDPKFDKDIVVKLLEGNLHSKVCKVKLPNRDDILKAVGNHEVSRLRSDYSNVTSEFTFTQTAVLFALIILSD